MKQIPFFVFLFISLGLRSQVSVQADVTTGCNPMLVSFSIKPDSARDTITSIEWNFGTWIPVNIDLFPSILYDSLGTYDVICTINGSHRITVADFIQVMNCDDSLYIPNVFSPNDDNLNDVFKVDTDGTSIYNFSVYTRSGTLVYKTESPSILWDGRTLSGQKMKNGIYFYIIRRLDEVPLNEVKGIVYLFE